MGALEGKIAIVTGGNSGIGLATAKRFVEEGAYVFITARRQSELDKAVAEIGRNVTAIAGDLAKLEDVGKIAETAKAKKSVVDSIEVNQEPNSKTVPARHRADLLAVQSAGSRGVMSSCTLDADDKNALWDDRHRSAINCTELLSRGRH